MDETTAALHLRPTWIGPYHLTSQHDRSPNGAPPTGHELEGSPSASEAAETD